MDSIINIILYTLVFLSVYAQIFFFVTFLENRKKIITRKGETTLAVYPSVTITVPCWNEESTIHQTVQSLLNLNYPKDKLKIFLVDDGSTDNTWNVIKQFEGYENIKIFHKENGGWSGAAQFFVVKNIGTCSYGVMSVKASNTAAELAAEDVTYIINKKPTITTVEGSPNTGFIYKIEWYDNENFHELECANMKYSSELTISVTNLAKDIDNQGVVS